MPRTRKVETPIILPTSQIVGYQSSLASYAVCLQCATKGLYNTLYDWHALYDTDVVGRSIYCMNDHEEHVGIVCRQYRDIDEIITANKVRHQHFFDESTLRFFDSRVYATVYGGRYFITSEKFDHTTPRFYTVRKCWFGNIETVGEFNKIPTLARAQVFAMALAEGYATETAEKVATTVSIKTEVQDGIRLQPK